ncbi:hypothetical protein V6N11_047729 [Hibiscus sabdariffa]|uniref:Uncharacterized protein n=2 Tax=Hibiscus sabdariffa TaxID=183260 RepID=A0ABR2BA59_9ROSI
MAFKCPCARSVAECSWSSECEDGRCQSRDGASSTRMLRGVRALVMRLAVASFGVRMGAGSGCCVVSSPARFGSLKGCWYVGNSATCGYRW